MGIGKKILKGIGAVVVTVNVGAIGVVSSMLEDATKIDGGNIISDIAYAGKSAAFNTVRKAWGKEPKVYDEAMGTTSEAIYKKQEAAIRKAAAEKGLSREQTQQIVAGLNNTRSNNTRTKGTPRVHYQEGAPWNKTAFVFSCPGQTEMRLGSVCAGTTGVNLSMVLEYCNQVRPDVFPSSSKSDYLITNASDIVHFMNLTNDTEADDEEILAKENLMRLREELNSKTTIICMGERAKKAVTSAHVGGRVVLFNHHLSNQKLNRTYTNEMFDENLSPEERRAERIRLVSEELLRLV